jgi:hypothetical protein
MSKWPMRGHFRHLHVKTFLMTPRTPQCKVFWPFNLSSKFSGVSEDSKFPLLGVWASLSHLAQSGVATSWSAPCRVGGMGVADRSSFVAPPLGAKLSLAACWGAWGCEICLPTASWARLPFAGGLSPMPCFLLIMMPLVGFLRCAPTLSSRSTQAGYWGGCFLLLHEF